MACRISGSTRAIVKLFPINDITSCPPFGADFISGLIMAKASVTQRYFDSTPAGEAVTLFCLDNGKGMSVDIINFGGIITAIRVPDREGKIADVALGFDELEPYLGAAPYFGALIGRFGNRIANGRFELDGQSFQLEVNNPPNHLHGGVTGFDKVIWHPTPFVTADAAGLRLFYLSRNGDQGYPGNLQVTVTYQLGADNALLVDYHAITDAATPINLTQHSYFNLAGKGDILDHQLWIDAAAITPVDERLIPTGELMAVTDTPFDFSTPKRVGQEIDADHAQLVFAGGYDHNYVLNKPQPGALSLAARVVEPVSGRVLEVLTEEPGVQFYAGNFLDGTLQGRGKVYGKRSGLCLEPQHYPDSPNQPGFPSTILRPGDEYTTRTLFRFPAPV